MQSDSLKPSDLNPILPSLRRRIFSGGGIVMGGFGAGQILRLISNLILTRLLAPEAFGLMAVAISINIWAVMLTDIGIGASVIRSPNSEQPSFLRTAWTMKILRNFLVWVIICLAAVGVGLLSANGAVQADSIFADPILPWIMAAIAIQLPIDGFSSINRSLAERKLMMTRVVGLEVARQLFVMTVTISFALMGYGVWALVFGILAGSVFATGLSHVIFPGPRMSIMLVGDHFREIFHFGKWLIIASFFGFILNRGDQLLFGWMMESNAFSLYAVASIWVLAGTAVVETIIGRIFFPAFSEVFREAPESIENLYRKTRLIADLFVVSIAYGAFLLAEPVFSLIYPDNYSGVGYYVKLLAPMLLFLPYRLINTAALASGDSKGFTAVTVVGGTALMIFVPLAATYLSAKAAILTFSCIAAASLPVIWRLGKKFMKLDLIVEGRMIVAAVVLVLLLALTPQNM
ncbi:oligosaccharide flippase family protein [Hyphococcus flavus]|uniref:Oligosaccharide flippase family protein n=1 Tax=Hyphococcus flavus TaxID=1866326 RepID=A0AAE9ZH92_9PROT|nr:oligosaccharide flippase family protein [Hyphococcus flavus]WDI32497.1 oligosaccharide flippase family protein [Hyphococcus flavus]